VAFDRQTVGEFLDRWLEDSVKPSVRRKTHADYAHAVKKHLKPALGRIQLIKLSPQQVQTFLNEKLTHGLSPRTVQLLRAVLRRALVQALKWDLVIRNVATLVDPPRLNRSQIEPFSPDEAVKFFEKIKGDRLEALFILALALGLRQGELLGLRWDAIDSQKRTLRVSYALQRIDKQLQLVEPKSERSRRTLPLPEIALNALRTHRVRQLEEKMAAGDDWSDTGFVFTTDTGKPIDARNLIRKFHSLLEKAKVTRRPFHSLRHSCASFLLMQNVPSRTVMDILGHSQISLTLNTYQHVMPSMLREAATAMDSAFAAHK
jgi:integrase